MKDIFSWQYEKSIMPSELLKTAFDFDRDMKKLWALELPVEEISSAELEWHLDMPFFWQPNKPFSLTPRDVLKYPQKYEAWINRIMEVDTTYPIDIILWNGKWQILDGLHRFCQHYLDNMISIKVRKVPVSLIPAIAPNKRL